MKKVLTLATFVVMSATVFTGVIASGTAGATTAAGGGAPMLRPGGAAASSGLPTVSENWSGYAVTSNKPFTDASTEFVQPTITCNGKPQVYTSNWVGIDGFNDQTVEQDGTAGYCSKKSNYMQPNYYAWIEMYPLPEVIAYKVSPGDVISASVRDTASGTFTLTITDVTTGKTHTQTANCSKCERDSAEWIIERPAGCNKDLTKCFLFALANYGTTTMAENVAAVDGGAPQGLSTFKNQYPIYMVQPDKSGFYALDGVGPVHAKDNSFTATWWHYGQVTPIQL